MEGFSVVTDIKPTSYSITILAALQRMPMYEGTVPRAVVARRRAKNKVAKMSRKVNR